MRSSLDTLRYQSTADPLEPHVSFDQLQSRPTGFQTSMERSPMDEQMNSLQFRDMEGRMFDQARGASQQILQEQARDV